MFLVKQYVDRLCSWKHRTDKEPLYRLWTGTTENADCRWSLLSLSGYFSVSKVAQKHGGVSESANWTEWTKKRDSGDDAASVKRFKGTWRGNMALKT